MTNFAEYYKSASSWLICKPRISGGNCRGTTDENDLLVSSCTVYEQAVVEMLWSGCINFQQMEMLK